MDSSAIPRELLADIFLRLPTPADLIRASAACVSFRRVAADRSFLRRFRELHAPPLLGFLDEDRQGFHRAIPPHPSAPAAGAVAAAADFSFSFLPAPASRWSVRDVRDGRVLLCRPAPHDAGEGIFEEIVVSDPLYRQYRLLPPIPDDLAASVKDPFATGYDGPYGEIFLVPAGGDGEEEPADSEETSFRVIWMAQCKAGPVVFVFCSGAGQWVIPTGSVHTYMGSLGRHLLLNMSGTPSLEGGCFTVDVETFKLERVCGQVPGPFPKLHAYCNYPPSVLLSPTVSIGAKGRGREPVGPSGGLQQHPLQGTGYLFPLTGQADQQAVCDAVRLPKLQEAADPGGVQGPDQGSADPAGHRHESNVVPTAAAQAPNPVLAEAGHGGRGESEAEAERADDEEDFDCDCVVRFLLS